MISAKEIARKVDALQEDLIELRRRFHRTPELSNREIKTSALIRENLDACGLKVTSGLAVTGVVGLLAGERPGKTLALRADMDALPIQETKNSPYRSEVPNVMHACGHDLHMTAVIGAARILSEYRDRLDGNIKFIFQPSEERVSGAERMIAGGAMKNPEVSAILGLHAYPLLPTGIIGIKYGVMMASSNRFSIHIYGKTGHSAKPHLAVDAISVSTLVVQAIHLIVSNRIDPIHPAVVSIGMIRGGTAENIVCDHVELRGTIRATSRSVRDRIVRKIEQKVQGITGGMDARYRFHMEKGSPPLDNHPVITRLVEKSAIEILGPEQVRRLEEPSMGGEDFSFYMERIPGCYFRIGTGNPDLDTCHYLHSDLFDIDEDAISEAVKVLCWSAIRYLNRNAGEETGR